MSSATTAVGVQGSTPLTSEATDYIIQRGLDVEKSPKNEGLRLKSAWY